MVAKLLLLVAFILLLLSKTQSQISICEAHGGSCKVSCPDGFKMLTPSCSGYKQICCKKSVSLALPLDIFRRQAEPGQPTCEEFKCCTRLGGKCISNGDACDTVILPRKCKGTCQCCMKDNCMDVNNGCANKGGECKLKAVGCSGSQMESGNCNERCVCCVGPPSDTRPYCDNCGESTIDATRIVGGQDTNIGEYPWQVRLSLKDQWGPYLCGGSLIKKKWVLTAAHCFADKYESMLVSLGDHNMDDPFETGILTIGYSAEEILNLVTIHPDYEKPVVADNDIALIELKHEVTFQSNIKPVCLGMPEDIVVGSKVVVTGWGNTEYWGGTSQVLQEVALDLISVEECREKYQNTPQPHSITDNMVCTLTPDKDACLGDSGGPLIFQIPDGRWVQIGVVSFGYECAHPDGPGVYANVANYIDWITSTTGSDHC